MIRRTSRFGLRARTWAVALLAMVAATALLAQAALATTPAEGSGTFAFPVPPTVTSSRTADGNTFLTLTAAETMTGAISGTSTLRISQVIHSSGESNIKGIITCTCSVGGQSWTVELRFEGTGAGTAASPLDGQFVFQNGTAGLADIRGEGTFHNVGLAGTYTVRWHFDP